MADPSRLWGYVALTDPDTGEHHLLRNPDDPSVVNGYPARLLITFLEAPDLLSREVVIAQPCRPITFDESGNPIPGFGERGAYYYSVALLHDETEGGPPRVIDHPAEAGFDVHAVIYNPGMWIYGGHRLDHYSFDAPDPRWDVPGAQVVMYGNRRAGELPLEPCDPLPWQPLYPD